MPDLKKLITLEALQAALPSWLKSLTKPSYNADEISDNSTVNKFVTETDKANWNAKGTYSKPPGGIPKSDLSSIVQTSLEKADSALQSETDPTVPSWAKQLNKPSYTQDEVADGSTYKRVSQTEKSAWNGKQNALTTTQMQAVNSGITSEKVGQISTNQTNILYGSKTGAQNLIVCSDVNRLKEMNPDSTYAWWEGNVYKSASWTFAINGDGSITVDGAFPSQIFFYLERGNYDISRFKGNGIMHFTGCPSGGSENTYFLCVRRTTPDYYWLDGGSGIDINTSDSNFISSPIQVFLGIRANVTLSNKTFYPSLVLKTIYEQDSSFHIGALPNSDLTQLEAEDRAALAEEIDAGAKNLLQNTGTTTTISGVTFTVNSDGSVSTYGTSTAANITFEINPNFTFKSGTTYVLSGCPNGGSPDGYRLCTMGITYMDDYGNGVGSVNVGDNSSRLVAIYIKNSGTNMGTTQSPKKFYPMICTKAAFGVSQKFVPYRPSYDEITNTYLTKCRTAVVNSGSLDDVSTNTIAYYSNNVSGMPSGVSGYAICETTVFDANVMVQKLYMIDGVYNAFIRMKQIGTWRAWKQITNA